MSLLHPPPKVGSPATVLRGLRLRAGARLTITVGSGGERKVATFTVRNRRSVLAAYRCTKGGRLGSC